MVTTVMEARFSFVLKAMFEAELAKVIADRKVA